MILERKAKQLQKRFDRGVLNTARKIFNVENRRIALVELGKTVIDTEGVLTFPPEPVEPPTPPRLSWLGGKQYAHSNSRKNRPGHGPEFREASIENAGRIFATEIAKALVPTPESVTPDSVSITPVEPPADGLSA